MSSRKPLKVHGTYPFDSNRWRRVKDLSLAEAAEMVGVDVTRFIIRARDGSLSQCSLDEADLAEALMDDEAEDEATPTRAATPKALAAQKED